MQLFERLVAGDWALDHDPLLVFEHDSLVPLGRLQLDGKRLKVVAEHA